MESDGYVEKWITYGNDYFAAKELTVLPGRSVTIHDSGPYGLIVLQGHGDMGRWPIEAPALIRFGQLTNDEYFVSQHGSPGRRDHPQSQPTRSDRHAQAFRAAPGGPPRHKTRCAWHAVRECSMPRQRATRRAPVHKGQLDWG